MTFFFSLPNAREECLIFFFLLYYLLQLVNSIPSVEKREKKPYVGMPTVFMYPPVTAYLKLYHFCFVTVVWIPRLISVHPQVRGMLPCQAHALEYAHQITAAWVNG